MKYSIVLVVLCFAGVMAAPPQKGEEMLTAQHHEQQQQAQVRQDLHQDAKAAEADKNMMPLARSGYGIESYGAGAGAYGAGAGPAVVGVFPGAAASSPCQIPFLVSCSPSIVRGKSLSPCGGHSYGGASYGAVAAPVHAAAPAYAAPVASAYAAPAAGIPLYREAELPPFFRESELPPFVRETELPPFMKSAGAQQGWSNIDEKSVPSADQMRPIATSFIPAPVQQMFQRPARAVYTYGYY